MTLSQELSWRGFTHQTTYRDISQLDDKPLTFYMGVDPSADSMTVGHLAVAMMIKHFINHGHQAILLVGGATGLIGDPDGKAKERSLKSYEEILANADAIAKQYKQIFTNQPFRLVNNYDWLKDIGFLSFLREIGKHVPMRQMLAREFVQTRLGEGADGISYAEFSYSLIQAYDFLHLNRTYNVSLQICGSDQWGNSIAGVELIRRLDNKEAHVWSAPLIINKTTGQKFGKSEAGAIWLDATKTSPTQFYQFWVNCDDGDVEQYLKIYTLLDHSAITSIMELHKASSQERRAQIKLAEEVTLLVHGQQALTFAQLVTSFLIGSAPIAEADNAALVEIRQSIPCLRTAEDASIVAALVSTNLATSNTDARRLVEAGAITMDGHKVQRDKFVPNDFHNGRLLLRRGKAYKDTALIELG